MIRIASFLLGLVLVALPVEGASPHPQQAADFDAAMQRGVAALNAGDVAAASEAFREALGSRPNDPSAQTMLGTALLQLDDPNGALEQLLPAATALPDHYPARIGLARAYLALGREASAVPELTASVRLRPDDARTRGLLTTILVRQRRFDEAAPHARVLTSAFPRQAGLHRLLGVVELARQQDAAALAAFDAALALDAEDPDARYGRAAALRGLDRNDEAVEVLDALVNDVPERTDAWTLLGDIFAEREDIEAKLAAVGMYRTALDLNPNQTRVIASLFDLLAAANLDDEALELLTGSEATDADPELLLRLGRLQFERERLDDARATYRRAIELGGGAEASYRLGVVLVNLAELEAAEQAFRSALAQEPDRAAAARELGKVLLDRGRAGAALEVLADALSALPDDPTAAYLAGLASFRAGNTATAVERLRRAIELDPAHADAHYNLGLALRQAGDTEGSRRAITRAQELRATADDEPPLSVEERARATLRAGYLRYRVGSLEPAAELLVRATELAPDDEAGWFYLGLTRTAIGDRPAAISALERASELNPERAETWEILGRLYEAEGRTEDARRARETAAEKQDDG